MKMLFAFIFTLTLTTGLYAQTTTENTVGTEAKTQLKEQTKLHQEEFVQKMKELQTEYQEGKMTKSEYQNKKMLLTREHAKDKKKLHKEFREEKREEKRADKEQARGERQEKRKSKRNENRNQ